MYLFGHLGIGSTLANPFRKNLPYSAVLLGTILSDLLDKPLYYGLSWMTGKRGLEIGLISGTRTFGHTLVFLGLIYSLGKMRGSRNFLAIGLGISTHLLLDTITELFLSHSYGGPLFWPLTGWQFPEMPYRNFKDHLFAIQTPFLITCEILGMALLIWQYRKTRGS